MSQLMLVNPRRRRKTRKTKKTVARRRPTRRISTRTVHRRRRRNPVRKSGLMGIVQSSVIPAATAAAGAVGLDVIWGYIPLPETLKSGPMRHVAKAAGAIALGMLAGMLVNRRVADQISTGALTVVMHGAMKDGMARFAPNIQMGEYLDDGMGYYGTGIDADTSMGVYLDNPSSMPQPSPELQGMGLDYEDLVI